MLCEQVKTDTVDPVKLNVRKIQYLSCVYTYVYVCGRSMMPIVRARACMRVYTYICIHTYIRARINTFRIHAYLHICVYAYV
jgi:hypothetical protein